jgi:hypothetical protein
MPVRGEGGLSIGQLCQQALRESESHAATPGTLEVLPGLRCGQAFGAATPHGTSKAREALARQSLRGTSQDTDGSDESGDLEGADDSDKAQAPDYESDDSSQESGYASDDSEEPRYTADDDSGDDRADYSDDESADSDENGDHEHSDAEHSDHEHSDHESSDEGHGDHDGGSDH